LENPKEGKVLKSRELKVLAFDSNSITNRWKFYWRYHLALSGTWHEGKEASVQPDRGINILHSNTST